MGESWENVARSARKEIFKREALAHNALVFTAHQADDLAETLLWRLFTGAAKTHGGGIAARHGVEIRPFVSIRKQDLVSYLKEEGQSWREDMTNHSGRFLRSKMRLHLMPVIEEIFPRAIEHLVKYGIEAQNRQQFRGSQSDDAAPLDSLRSLFEATGLRPRRSHWDAIQAMAERNTSATLQLGKGWGLRYEPATPVKRGTQWILQGVSGRKK
jgi:tRNA(Ile)-lysidine synthase TilS/MesJ